MTSYIFFNTYRTVKGTPNIKKRVLFLHKNYLIFEPTFEDEELMKVNVSYVSENMQVELLKAEQFVKVTNEDDLQRLDEFLDKYELHQIH